jgi:6-pyruvoyltetrahydropterin/6-carboxytetrahydropterin synthase
MKILSELIKTYVLDPFDHKNLNEQVEEFKTLIPTAENIAVVIYNKFRPHIDPSKELIITLYETPRNYVTYAG